MSRIALRAYTHREKAPPRGFRYPDPPLRHERVLVFDTETTEDQYQSFKVGYFLLLHAGCFQLEGLFYDPSMNSEEELGVLREVAIDAQINLYTLEEFIEEVFYPEVFGFKALCVGFNLAFDISRIAKKWAYAKRKNKGGFSFTLSEKTANPTIIIKKVGTAFNFKFGKTINNKGEAYYSGYFLDAQRLAEVLLSVKRVSLAQACELLNTQTQKKAVEGHGRITARYLDYLITDVHATREVYERLVEELDTYGIAIPLTKVFSEASIGKYAMKQLGITPFMQQNSNFPPQIFGKLITAYYGGRCECRCRKTPMKVSTLDFTSMYPTVTMLLGLWDFLIAESLDVEDATDEVLDILYTVNLGLLQDRSLWKKFVVLVKIKPYEDILPVRMDYKGDQKTFNVGINYLTADFGLWYALPDVIASVLLTGKVPQILTAVRFIPKGIQKGLKQTDILGITLDPRSANLFQVLVEERQKIKRDPPYMRRAQALKILVNAISYGIFIELNPNDTKSSFTVMGLDCFDTDTHRYEKTGEFFHPLLGVMITSASRLFLAMAEVKVKRLGGRHAYMDTDSIFVPPERVSEIIEYFQPLNPYSINVSLLKEEKSDAWFLGISSKRYVLYDEIDGEIELRDYKLHGLGHLTNPFSSEIDDWQAEIWIDLLTLSGEEIVEKYATFYAISKLSVSTANIMPRFWNLNKGREYKDQIKPFNFFLVGFHTMKAKKKIIKPLAPFSRNYQEVVHKPFVEYESGEIMEGMQHFKPLSSTISQYLMHPEYKFLGNTGFLRRKYVLADEILYIGKEANNIDEEAIEVKEVQKFLD